MSWCLSDLVFQKIKHNHVSSPEIVAGERLAAGDYTVRWEGVGPNVEFRVMHGAKVLFAAPARIVHLDNAAASDSVVVQTYDDGIRRVSLISFSAQKVALQIDESSGSVMVRSSN